jgi:predicted dehydrogenase
MMADQLQDNGGQSPVRWGIVGAGTIASHFASDLALTRGGRLEAVTSRTFASAEAFAARHGGIAVRSLPEMLAADLIDALYVASPNDSHVSFAEAAIEADKAVLVEKPLAATSADAARLAALAAARGVFLMEAMWTRFLPAASFVRQAIRSNEIGAIRRVEAELAFHKPYNPTDRYFDLAAGGGSLLDLGVYGISLCLDLFGRPDAVSGSWRAAPSGVDLRARVDMRFGDMPATVHCGFDAEGANLFRIEGARGSLVLQPPFNASRMVIRAAPGPAYRVAMPPGVSTAARVARKLARSAPLPGLQRYPQPFDGHGLQFEIDAVADALRAGLVEHPAAPLDDTIATLRIIERILEQKPSLE